MRKFSLWTMKPPYRGRIDCAWGVSPDYCPAEAKPRDIIFFTGTYDSSGPVSHVGINAGDNMILHCASGGVQYAQMGTKYWTEHFYPSGA